jgi:hypothetical protein
MLRIILIFLLSPIFVFSQTNTRSFPKDISIDSTGKISICLTDSANETVYLECFRWNKWVKLDTIQRKISDADTCIIRMADQSPYLQQFRLEYKFPDGNLFGSKVAKIESNSTSTECLGFAPCKLDGRIHFNCEQSWEIYDQYGQLVRKGKSKDIDVFNLPAGGYFLNYTPDNTSEFFVNHDK